MKKLILVSAVSMLIAGNAVASQIYIDVGADYGGGAPFTTAAGPTTTGWKDSLKLTYESSSVVQDLDGSGTLSEGDTILSKGGYLPGGDVAFGFGSNKITELVVAEDPISGTGPSDNGFGGANWQLSLRFDDLVGVYKDSLSDFQYTAGTIDWLLFDGTNGISTEVHLFTTTIGAHTSAPGNQVFTGELSNFGVGSVNGVDIGDIFNIAYGGGAISFEDYAALTGMQTNFRIDQNSDLANGNVTYDAIAQEFTIEKASHDGSLEFNVPEPASIAILGLGLLGFAGSRKRKFK